MLAGMALWAMLGAAWARTLSLPEIVRLTMAAHFEAGHAGDSLKALPVPTPYRKRAGVFVTLSRQGKPRACWGSLYPQQANLVEATVAATRGALSREYRYPPITRSEWQTLKPQVTVIKAIEPIDRLAGQNPLQDGLMVRSGTRSGIILPGEASDATYQLVQARLKAGIAPHDKYQLYRIIADVYR